MNAPRPRGARMAGSGTRARALVAGEQAPVELHDSAGGHRAELVAQQAAQLLVDAQRLGDVPGRRQGLHQQPVAALAVARAADELPRRALGGAELVAADGESAARDPLERLERKVLHPEALRLCPLLVVVREEAGSEQVERRARLLERARPRLGSGERGGRPRVPARPARGPARPAPAARGGAGRARRSSPARARVAAGRGSVAGPPADRAARSRARRRRSARRAPRGDLRARAGSTGAIPPGPRASPRSRRVRRSRAPAGRTAGLWFWAPASRKYNGPPTAVQRSPRRNAGACS